MRFVCDSCRAQYMISDDKVGAKGVKVRCKKCGHVILVRRAEPAAELEKTQVASNPLAALEAAGEGAGAAAEGALFEGATEDEFGAVFDQVLSGGPGKLAEEEPAEKDSRSSGSDEDDLGSTRQLDLATAQRLADASGRGEGAAEHEWFVAIDEKQVGPLGVDAVREHWERGEIGPDSLCWRAGLADWLPLSEVTELQRHLAPGPARPVIVAPAPVTPSATSAPVESAFSAGAAARPAGASAPVAEAGGWKPSAASALASLVKEEMEVLAKPAPAKAPAPAKVPAAAGLLDVPEAAGTGAAGVQPGVPVLAPSPVAAAPYPVQPGYPAPATGYPAPPAYAPAYAAPMPPAAPAKSSKVALAVAVSALVIAAVAVGAALRPVLREPEAPVAAQPTPAPAQPQAAVTPPPATPVQAPAAATPPPAAPAQGVAQAQPASGTAAPAVAAPAAGMAEETRAPAAAVATPKPVETAAEPVKQQVAKAEPARRTPAPRPTERPAERPARREEPVAAEPERTSDDPFEDIFGTPKAPPKKAAPAPRAAVYVPPAPGGGDVQDSLGQSDIMQVVLANRPAIVQCVQKQKASDPGLSGKLVMRWTVLPSGRVTSVSCQSPEFKDSEMARCISGLVKGWTFPKHRRQGDPINFPFTF